MALKHSKSYILKLLLYMIIITSVFMTISFIGINRVYDNSQLDAQTKMEFETSSELTNIANFIAIRFSKIVDMIQNLSTDYEILTAFEDDDFKVMVEEKFKNIVTYSDDYLQLRLIDLEGHEIVRVDNVDGKPISLDESALQDKSDRYYFKEMTTLKSNQLYFSPFDLNMENGKIDVPYVPTYRVGKALYKNDRKVGYLIVNYHGDDVLKVFDYHFHYTNGGKVYLANTDGDFYISEDGKEDTWGFMFDKDNLLEDKFPNAASSLLEMASGYLYDEEDGFLNILYFNPLLFNMKGDLEIVLSENANYEWILIHNMSNENLSTLSNFTNKERFSMLLTLFILTFIVSLFVSERILEKRAHQNSLIIQATTDPLTGIMNRAAGLKNLQKMVDAYGSTDFHLVFLDMDYLKLVNDSLGHEKGDTYIKAFSECVITQIRDQDLFFRYAGDEFILCFRGSNTITVERIMNRIRDQFRRENPIIVDDVTLGFAYGIEEYNQEKHPLIDQWIAQADSKMYRYKTNKKAKSTET